MLALVPKVTEAVRAFNAEQRELWAALQESQPQPVVIQNGKTPKPSTPLPQMPVYPALAPQSPMLMTPERAEFEAARQAGVQLEAEPELPHLAEARRKRMDTLRHAKLDGTRAAKMAQFEPGPEDERIEDVVVSQSQLNVSGS